MANKAIGTLGTIPSLTVGRQVFTDVSTNLIMLFGCTAGHTAGTPLKSSMRRNGATTAYAVTSAKTYTVQALIVSNGGTGVEGPVQIAQADNDVGIANSGALTNPVYFLNNIANFDFNGGADVSSSLNEKEHTLIFAIAAGKYLACVPGNRATANSRSLVTSFGYEA